MTTAKHLLAFFLLLAAPVFRVCAEEFPASDTRITWIGRTEVRGGDVSFDWSGVYAVVHFRGDSLQLRASGTGKNWCSMSKKILRFEKPRTT